MGELPAQSRHADAAVQHPAASNDPSAPRPQQAPRVSRFAPNAWTLYACSRYAHLRLCGLSWSDVSMQETALCVASSAYRPRPRILLPLQPRCRSSRPPMPRGIQKPNRPPSMVEGHTCWCRTYTGSKTQACHHHDHPSLVSCHWYSPYQIGCVPSCTTTARPGTCHPRRSNRCRPGCVTRRAHLQTKERGRVQWA